MITRRHLIRAMGALLAAPAIVRVGSLMSVRSLAPEGYPVADYLVPGTIQFLVTGLDAYGRPVRETIGMASGEVFRSLGHWQHITSVKAVSPNP